jgi:DNA replication and repair protein RecF
VKRVRLDIWRRYHRALKQRNAALKASASPRDLAVWDGEPVRAAELMDAGRRIRRAPDAFADFGGVLGAPTGLRYQQGWQGDDTYAAALDASASRDHLYKTTHVGPHRADLEIQFQSTPARHLASRGQQKMLAVGLGLAQAHIIAMTSPRRLVLLLDDPVAEIDGDRASVSPLRSRACLRNASLRA